MNVVSSNVLRLHEKLTHVAFGCGCVRTLGEHDAMAARCPQHGSLMLSKTEEYVPRSRPLREALAS